MHTHNKQLLDVKLSTGGGPEIVAAMYTRVMWAGLEPELELHDLESSQTQELDNFGLTLTK